MQRAADVTTTASLEAVERGVEGGADRADRDQRHGHDGHHQHEALAHGSTVRHKDGDTMGDNTPAHNSSASANAEEEARDSVGRGPHNADREVNEEIDLSHEPTLELHLDSKDNEAV